MVPDDAHSGDIGPPDRQTLRLLERQLASDPLVVDTSFEPDSYEPRALVADIDSSRYPESVRAARLELRWFTTDDFSVHYIETHDDRTQWECRWDRHPNTHNARMHFHQPPTAEEVTDLSLASVHPLDIYSTVLTAVEERCEDLWDRE